MTATRATAVAPVRSPEPRPDLTVVRRRRARRSLLTRLGTVMLLSLFAAVLGIVVFQTLRVQNQAKLDELDRRIAVAEDRAKELQLGLADAQAPGKIADAARTRLGMIPPGDIAYLQPKPDDEANAAWDPAKEPLPAPPTTAPPATTVPPTTAPPTTVPSATAKGTGANGRGTTATTKAPTTTAKAPTTTVKAPTTTAKAPTTTAKAPTTTVRARTTTP